VAGHNKGLKIISDANLSFCVTTTLDSTVTKYYVSGNPSCLEGFEWGVKPLLTHSGTPALEDSTSKVTNIIGSSVLRTIAVVSGYKPTMSSSDIAKAYFGIFFANFDTTKKLFPKI